MAPTVLVIEDDPGTALLMRRQLGFCGYTVLSASTGRAGLETAQAHLPDLILLDLMLPELDGFEVLSRLRAGTPTAEVPVVIVSAKLRGVEEQRAFELGANGCMLKPFELGELTDLIRSLLAESQLA